MALGSQAANLDTIAGLSTFVHDVFVNRIKPHLDHLSPVAGLFRQLGPGGYTIIGKKLNFAGKVRASGGAIATGGQLPDHQFQVPVNFNTTPARTYVRRAVDNFIVAAAVQPGAYEDFMGEVEKQAVEAFERMQTRHIFGASTGTVCLCDARTSQTITQVKDGYAHTGTNPLLFIEKGDILAWHDASNSFAVGGAGSVASVAYSTKRITWNANFDDGATTITSGDVLAFATTTSTTADYFKTERQATTPLGLRDILDPDANNSSYLGVAEAGNERTKPLRRASSTWGEVEFMDFVGEIEAASNSPVTPDSHVFSLQRAPLNELARTLVSYTQVMGKGQDLVGGWETVSLANNDFLIDGYHTHNELMAHSLEDYFVVDLDGEPGVWAGDGNQYRRLSDFDGKEWFMKHYLQRFADRRNRSGTLTGISISDYDADRFASVPR